MDQILVYQIAVVVLVVLIPLMYGWGNIKGYVQGLREGGDMLIDLLVKHGDLDGSYLHMKHNKDETIYDKV